MRWRMLTAFVFIVGATGLALTAERGDEAGVAKEAIDFKGKVLVVSIGGNGGTIQNGRVQQLGGRAFLVGESIGRKDDDPRPEETIWFAMDKVTLFRVFKSVEDVRKVFDAEDAEDDSFGCKSRK